MVVGINRQLGTSSSLRVEARTLLQAKFPDVHFHEDNLQYYAWPEMFGNTAGPFGGIGGQAFTTFTIEAWVDFPHYAVIFCGEKILRVIDDWEYPYYYNRVKGKT